MLNLYAGLNPSGSKDLYADSGFRNLSLISGPEDETRKIRRREKSFAGN